jgi:hypothetical protein
MRKYKEAKDVAVDFETELRALLIKWDADIYLDNSGNNYVNDSIILCAISSKWLEGVCVSEYAEINFGTYIG